MDEKTLTVAALIERLKELPGQAPVFVTWESLRNPLTGRYIYYVPKDNCVLVDGEDGENYRAFRRAELSA